MSTGAVVPRRRSGRWVRRTLALLVERDGPYCGRCGGQLTYSASGMAADGPTVGHVVPLSAGGTDGLVNLRPEHRRCNVEARDAADPPAAVALPVSLGG